jgi:hypothetical protein
MYVNINLRIGTTVKPVYKGHSRKLEMYPYGEIALYIQVKIICTIHKWENCGCPL